MIPHSDLLPVAGNDRALPIDSRIYHLAQIVQRRFDRWGTMPSASERRIVLALAEDILPDPFPPSPEEILVARLIKIL